MGNIQRELKIEDPKLNRYIENIVKNHLEIIVLSMLSEKPMCGYDLIRDIFAKYNVLLSQGTVYPLLYSLKDEGIVQPKFTKGDMRTKRYSITDEGRQNVEKKIYEFVEAEIYVLDSISGR